MKILVDEMLKSQPEFSNKCDWGKLSIGDWLDLLQIQPQFADKCDWGKLNVSNSLVDMLMKQPQLSVHCDTAVIHGEGKAELLKKHPESAKCFPEQLRQ